ncbi:hypothetical protein MGN70_013799 [Eutypa lata]|uniref:Putative bile acid 7-alpha protein n=1 Tax=Eutypa lata (strain UCR-EL1) TaxID=1287681 RepID=M7SYA1_EUTLA|nr:putative bile acid 7-alpha protein [Eutypa lata UCREL1]KAI1243931.1 hypothetical protein MGN70_013799 [Eutypa lata]
MAVAPEVAEIIRRKKTQYCRFADTSQWELFGQIALPEAILEFYEHGALISQGGTDWSFTRDRFIAFCSAAWKDSQTAHMVGPGELKQINPDEVEAVWNGTYHVGAKGSDSGVFFTGGGYYTETWKRKGDDWFIQHMRFDRLFWKQSSS